MAENPFVKATPVTKKIKVLVYGPAKSGKTTAALTFPGPLAIVDAERGTDMYAGRPTFPEFSVMHSSSLAELEEAVAYVNADGGQSFSTLVIDPITVFYSVAVEAASKSNNKRERDNPYTLSNARMRYLYNRLVDLPVHLVVIARQATNYRSTNGFFEAVGVKPDADKSVDYPFDFIVRMEADHTGIISGRFATPRGETHVPHVSWDLFKDIADTYAQGVTVETPDEEAAVEAEVRCGQAASCGLTSDEAQALITRFQPFFSDDREQTIRAIRGVIGNAREWTGGFDAAVAHLEASLAQTAPGMPGEATAA